MRVRSVRYTLARGTAAAVLALAAALSGPQTSINGTEKVEHVSNTALGCTPGTASALACVTWTEDLTLSGRRTGTKGTGPGGFTLGPAAMLKNDFQALGTLTTSIDGTTYSQPANGS
ncbi:hypothetical protein [Streptomyces sp. NPDC050759]|uniref:hypothetical protein n=1 Tax=Streptomyces sp. NPDC050759 TaxID=3365635 RepID=UPI003798EA30